MSGRAKKPLTAEDRILWHRVARTVSPIDGKTLPPLYGLGDQDATSHLPAPPAAPKPAEANKPRHPEPASHHPHTRQIDKPVRNKIAAGRIEFDARIDLHGMTQHEAHAMLYEFLHQAYQRRLRHVLVITGKGASHGSEGVLRRAVPQWLATPPFRPFVSGMSDAARHHGGDGALYIRVRRADRARKA